MHFQIHCLHGKGYSVYLICNENLYGEIQEKNLLAGRQLHEIKYGNFLSELKNCLQVKKFLEHHNISYAIINTADHTIIRNLSLLLPASINYTAIVHDAGRLERSTTFKKIISRRIKKFFVLSDYILKNIHAPSFQVQAFYPLYFPGGNTSIHKQANEFWIGIPGVVSQERRDYIRMFTDLTKQTLPQNIKLILAGKLDKNNQPEIYKLIKELKDNIIFFDTFVPYKTFHAYIKQCDVLLPLLDNGNDYFKHRISGTLNLSFAYHIPLCVDDTFKYYDDISQCSIFYEKNNLAEFIRQLPAKENEMNEIKTYMQIAPQFKLDYQCSKYIEFVEQ